MITESFLLTGLGAASGVLLVFVLTGSMVRVLPPLRDIVTRRLALSVDFGPDWRVLLFSFGISALTALIFGVALALSVSRTRIDSALRGVRSSGGWRGRQAVLVFQIALCTLLLSGAGLLIRTFEQLHNLDAGFDRDHLVTFTADPSLSGYTAAQEQTLLAALRGRVREIPGVVSVAFAAPGSGAFNRIVDDLVEYPWGCAEQTASRLIPLSLAYPRFAGAPAPLRDGLTMRLQTNRLRLVQMAGPDAVFAWWGPATTGSALMTRRPSRARLSRTRRLFVASIQTSIPLVSGSVRARRSVS